MDSDQSDVSDDDESSSGEDETQVDGEDDDDPLASSDDDEHDHEDPGSETSSEGVISEEDSSPDDTETETQFEKDRKSAFFATQEETSKTHVSFLTMNLSRPILKALTSIGFSKPTPIQAATIPVALLGKDVVGGAVTGSGKTAAFTIPMLERLLYREKGKRAAATRCLILVPTRELAVQCFDVGSKLASQTDIRFCLVVGNEAVCFLREKNLILISQVVYLSKYKKSHSAVDLMS